MKIRPLFLSLLLLVGASPFSPAQDSDDEEPAFKFDGGEYFLRSTEGGILEYLTAGETFKNWTTLFSIREFSGTDDPKAYAQKLLENAKASSPEAQGLLMENEEAGSYIVDFLLPDGEGDNVGYEWNLWRVEKKGDGVEAVQYAMRIPAGSEVTGEAIAEARKKIVPELAEFEVPTASDDADTAGDSDSESADQSASSGDTQTYAYPDADQPQFTMELPADWVVEGDAKGAWIVAADKKFTTSVVVVDVGDVENAVESIKEQSGGRFESVEWSETMSPRTNPATGVTLRSIDGSAEAKGVKHKLGVLVFSKDGAEKAFILSTWAPEADLDGNGEAIMKMLVTATLP